MANLNGFNADDVEPTAPFDALPLPAGKYLAAITASDMKVTRANDGSYLELQFQILDGEYKGRYLWARLNIENPNAKAVQIARGHLSAICRAVGVMQPRDSVDLHNIPLVISVKCKKREDTGEMTNEIKGYEAEAASSDQPQQAQADDATPPWKR
jgi:hypothetical protein